ncbi:MAG: excinuclease ABC subunit UvrA [Planctomycetota bacterium JB042]
MTLREIVVQGAREHNLKGVDLRVPRGTLTTITGVSGSGKSSLAFDTIYQEGQRRFVESLSAYARQFLGTLEKPKVDHVEGLSPTISIDQKTVNRNPRSTVGTITEIHDHLRLLFARLGTPHCVECGRTLSAQTRDQIADRLLERGAGRRVQVLAPIVRGRKGEYRKELEALRLKGFVRARVDGEEVRLDEPESLPRLARNKKHDIEVVVDRLKPTPDKAGRLAEAVETAARMAGGVVAATIDDEEVTFSASLSCPDCGVDFPELEPRLFSFNSPYGACDACAGLGESRSFDVDLIVPNQEKSIREGCFATMTKTGYLTYSRLGPEALEEVARFFGFTLDQPWRTLTKAQQDVLLYGSGKKKLRLKWEYETAGGKKVKGEDLKPIPGLVPTMENFWRMTKASHLERYMTRTSCPECEGTRLGPAARAVTFRDRTIDRLEASTVEELRDWFEALELAGAEAPIGAEVVKEIRTRLRFLVDVGLGYLPLDRGARTLSGGEAQRVRLATQVGAELQGVLYVLDEPSIGLHARDNQKLLGTLKELRDRGNTVVVVEHDKDTMLEADWLVDVGPGAGTEGGEIVAVGTPAEVLAHESSITARYLRDELRIERPAKARAGTGEVLAIRGARQHNLKGVDVEIPLGRFVAVTGVSGSGKSTLVDKVLKRALARTLHGARAPVGAHDAIEGIEHVDKVVEIDQAPIGRTPRSNPATYSGAFDHVRDLFAMLPESKARGYKKGRFSFNVSGGRCEECGGAGVQVVEMQFLADLEIPCDGCAGKRYNRETLEIEYRGKNVRDVLDMTVEEAVAFFEHHPKLSRILGTLHDVGLGYVALGQTATTLSGGEAQRLKLASELARPGTGRTLYILDEPTTGLHFADVERLIDALQVLVDAGNTVVVIEHNLDVVKVADWMIDLGPEGGAGGGEVVFTGTPRQAVRRKRSWTGRLLKEYLSPAAPNPNPIVRSAEDDGGRALNVHGATKNNLRRVDVSVPHGSFTVVTGVSGSGKTSLAFDTIFAEAQRRFVESMSTYARRFLSRMDRAPVDRIEGLAPAIAIDRKAGSRNPRSTVATSTEIHDYLRVLYARVGTPRCPDCGEVLLARAPTEAAKDALKRFDGRRVRVLAPLWRSDFASDTAWDDPALLADRADDLKKAGFVRVSIDGDERRLDEELPDAAGADLLELVVDRLGVKKGVRVRLADALEEAYRVGKGIAVVRDVDGVETVYTDDPHCPTHGARLDDDLHPRMFSFNSHLGACETCDGLGRVDRADVDRLVVRPEKPLLFGALALRRIDLQRLGAYEALKVLLDELGVDRRTPFEKLPARARRAVLEGYDRPLSVNVKRESRTRKREYVYEVEWEGLLARVARKYRGGEDGGYWRRWLAPYVAEGECEECVGERLNPLSRAVEVGGETIGAVARKTVAEAAAFFSGLRVKGARRAVAAELVREVRNRLDVLNDIGLGYLELARASATLSGGEAQRIRLATQLGNRLVGVLYVLDEPTIGLHPRDTGMLLDTLKGLQKLGNTILVVEHDLDVIRAADWVIDVGPGAGHRGGTILAQGSPAAIAADERSLTGRYLSGEKEVAGAAAERPLDGPAIRLRGASLHNLKDVDVDVPLGVLTCVTGVSGSGKSTLVMDVLEPALRTKLDGRTPRGALRSLEVPRTLKGLSVVDQSPLGQTPASNPATYTGVFDAIRTVFASTPEARMKGFTRRRFSFNQAGGRCEACEGKGMVQVEMHFLSDVYVPCDACGGKRFDRETLAVTYGGRSIADVLEMEVDEAVAFFENHRKVRGPLELLRDVGLGYLRLGQPATTLSGGEAQRVKLAAELGKTRQGSTLYLLDEPTTGLHPDDVARLVDVLFRLVDAGHTVVVIEHNLDVIRAADLVIDLGPEGGDGGGRLVAAKPPAALEKVRRSATGARLRATRLAPRAGRRRNDRTRATRERTA